MMGLGWGTARRAVALVAVLATLGTGGGLGAQEAPAWDWEPTGLGEKAFELFTPASGAFFAKTASGLSRSDDGGVTWVSVALPPGFPGRRWGGVGVAVDPSDHTTLYVGTSVSRDDAATWVPMLPWPEQESFSAIAVSPSDRGLIYLEMGPTWPAITGTYRRLRSHDGGASWDELESSPHHGGCALNVNILEPHPTDASRLFRVAGCYAGSTTRDPLRQSFDQGTTWSDLLDPELARVRRLVGGQGIAPTRLYVAAAVDERSMARGGGSSLYRTDDDGQTWTEILAFSSRAERMGPLTEPNVQMAGLAYDPAEPARVYVGLNAYVRGADVRETPIGSGVKASLDGGATWTDLGRQDLGLISDLALGIDGRYLYAATDRGVQRLRLR